MLCFAYLFFSCLYKNAWKYMLKNSAVYCYARGYISVKDPLPRPQRDSVVFVRSKRWLECFMTVSTWPIFFIAFTGAKRHAITWINVSPPSLFSLCRLSFLLSMHTFSRLPARTNPLLCSPTCSEGSSSVCRELKQRARHSFPRLLVFVPPPSQCSMSLSDLFLNVPAGDFNHI